MGASCATAAAKSAAQPAAVLTDADGCLEWERNSTPAALGGNKAVFAAKFNGEDVVVCHARRSVKDDISRARNEISVLKKLGRHPSIVHMLAHGECAGRPLLVLERVDPIGFDLDRLWFQHALLGFKVPSALCARVFRQLIGALGHIHSKDVVHLDMKTANVLVTPEYGVKLCDFGMASARGTRRRYPVGYMSPEACDGSHPVGPEADCFGLGVVLHQMYQEGEWDLVDCSAAPAKLRQGFPLTTGEMPAEIRDAMLKLVRQAPRQRLTLQALSRCQWLSGRSADAGGRLPRAELAGAQVAHGAPSRRVLDGPLPLTVCVLVGKRHEHLIGQTLGDLGLAPTSPEDPVAVMFVKQPECDDALPRPDASTRLVEGSLLFLGVRGAADNLNEAMSRVKDIFSARVRCGTPSTTDSSGSSRRGSTMPSGTAGGRPIKWAGDRMQDVVVDHGLHECNDRGWADVADKGALYSFVVDFDAFVVPEGIGREPREGRDARGAAGATLLDLRRELGIDLAGVQRAGQKDVTWFPDQLSVIRPGDRGFVARCPCEHGSDKSGVSSGSLGKLAAAERLEPIAPASTVDEARYDAVIEI